MEFYKRCPECGRLSVRVVSLIDDLRDETIEIADDCEKCGYSLDYETGEVSNREDTINGQVSINTE